MPARNAVPRVYCPPLPGIREVMAFLRPYARGAWHWFALDALLSMLSIGAGLAAPALAGLAIDEAVDGRIGWGFRGLAVAMVLAVLIDMAAEPVRARFRAAIDGRLMRGIVDHALDLGLPGRRPFDDGDLQNRIRSEATHLPRYPETLLRIGTGILTAAGSLVALYYVHWVFVVVALAGVGSVTVLMRRLMGALTTGQTGYDELSSRMVNAYTGALAGRRTIRASGTLEREVERITEPLPKLVDKTRQIMENAGRGAVTVTSANHVVLTSDGCHRRVSAGRGRSDCWRADGCHPLRADDLRKRRRGIRQRLVPDRLLSRPRSPGNRRSSISGRRAGTRVARARPGGAR